MLLICRFDYRVLILVSLLLSDALPIDLRKLSDDELEAMENIMQKIEHQK